MRNAVCKGQWILLLVAIFAGETVLETCAVQYAALKERCILNSRVK